MPDQRLKDIVSISLARQGFAGRIYLVDSNNGAPGIYHLGAPSQALHDNARIITGPRFPVGVRAIPQYAGDNAS